MLNVVGGNKASSVKLKLGAGTELGNVLSSSRIASTSSVSQILRSPPKYLSITPPMASFTSVSQWVRLGPFTAG